MAWTKKQITTFMVASRVAGWNEDQRYMAMRHCGCPTRSDGVATPSVHHARNTNALFERCMALAESSAGQHGRSVTPPRGKKSWREAERRQGDRMRELAQSIVDEARQRIPDLFDETTLVKAIEHVCANDPPTFLSGSSHPLVALDAGQLYRVIESLKAHVGREFRERGIVPVSFSVPTSVVRRLAAARAKAATKAGAA